MNDKQNNPPPTSILHSVLSLIIPGLGQIIARRVGRGLSILISILVLGGLSVWTIAQRARFPDYRLSLNLLIPLLIQSGALLVFFLALRQISSRYLIKEPTQQAVARTIFIIIYIITVFFLIPSFLDLAGTQDQIRTIFGGIAVLISAGIAVLWFWQVADAGTIGALSSGEKTPSFGNGILYASIIIFILGFNITGINPEKAISEFQDTNIILRRIVWPWRNAFEFEEITNEVTQKIQAPCPEGSVGPEPNTPSESVTWVSVSLTCGELTKQDLLGTVTLGTEITISAGGFIPGQEVEILWKNPIGNPFKPRGVGETDILIDEDGGFTSTLFIPQATIAATAQGAQIHTLVVRQSLDLVFTGRLSQEMNLALIGILETIMIGLMATFFGIILAFPLSFLAARNLMTPIISPLNRVVGNLIGLTFGIWATTYIMKRVSISLGGITEAPFQIFGIGLFLLLILTYLGLKYGSNYFSSITEGDTGLSNMITGLILGGLAAGPGYLIGLGTSRGIVAIPIDPEIAATTEGIYAIVGAIIFGILGFVYGWRVGAQGEISIGLVIYSLIRTIMNIVRSIEPLIWAIVGAIWVGLGPFAGTIALTLHTIAALGKLYSESIENINPGPIEALQATGATRLQTIVYAVIPQVLPPFISFTIYRWDINVRLSTIIGLVGGGGIGFILIQWIRLFQYESAGLAVWLITITVATLDFVSANIRKRFV